jgi:hypothetical protein
MVIALYTAFGGDLIGQFDTTSGGAQTAQPVLG